jgi:hypothetical protein
MIARRRSAVMPDHPPISATVRPQPAHSLLSLSIAQTLMQGVSIGPLPQCISAAVQM